MYLKGFFPKYAEVLAFRQLYGIPNHQQSNDEHFGCFQYSDIKNNELMLVFS